MIGEVMETARMSIMISRQNNYFNLKMKLILSLLIVCNFLFNTSSFGQIADNTVFEIVDEDAEFEGGYPALMKFIQDNLNYPYTAIENRIQGKVTLKFIVEKNGSISNVTVFKGIPGCQECDSEALRVVQKMKNWKPGKINQKAVRQWNTLPISFAIQ
jgi:TonB family protein